MQEISADGKGEKSRGDEGVDVLYIAGSGRSGSTLLANILGSVPGCFGAGELRYLWGRGILEDRLCGCGQRFGQCPVWRDILDEAGLSGDRATIEAHARRMIELQSRATRIRHIPHLLRYRDRPQAVLSDLDDYADRIGSLYKAIAATSHSSVIVDSSKLPSYGFLLAGVPGVRIHVVHLVRDPRAAAYSWLRKKALPDLSARAFMERQSTVRSAALWDTWNTTARLLWEHSEVPYMAVRYEDFVAQPEVVVRSILGLVGGAPGELPFTGPRAVRLATNHTVAGNPNRLDVGQVTVRSDDEWMGSMRTPDRLLVTAVTAMTLRRFGYRLRVDGAARKAASSAA